MTDPFALRAGGVERAAARGGQVRMHGEDTEGRSQWAVLRDPDGAAPCAGPPPTKTP